MKKEVKHILVTLTPEQYQCLSYLRGKMGNSDAEVLRNVFVAWIWEKMGGLVLGDCRAKADEIKTT